MSDLLTAPRSELVKLIYDLIDENQSLKTQIAELQEKLLEKNPPGKTKGLPDFVKPNTSNKHHKKRKKRQTGYARKNETPTTQVFHAYDACPHCNGTLGKPSVSHTRQIIDVVLSPVIVTEHVVCKRWCMKCQKRVIPNVSFRGIAVGRHRIGANLMSMIVTMRDRLRLPIRVIKHYLTTFHAIKISEGEIVLLLDTVAGRGKRMYDTIKQTVFAAPSVHGDETGGRENGKNGYVWNFVTPTHQYMLYRKSRGSKVVKELIGEQGEQFDGVLTTDFYAAYNVHSGFHQRCWTHLLRDIHELTEEDPKNKMVKRWAHRIHTIYQEATTWSGPDPQLPIGTQAQERIRHEAHFKEKLKQICMPYLTSNTPQSPLCGRMIKFLPELFTFVRFSNVSPTNNLAERTLRHTVVQRKISGGTRSVKGSETRMILGSLFGTWNLQGLNPFQECRKLLLSPLPCP